ncbi:MAG TPA: hypothetical protein VIG39_04505, partial [Rhizomicrobium sp.]
MMESPSAPGTLEPRRFPRIPELMLRRNTPCLMVSEPACSSSCGGWPAAAGFAEMPVMIEEEDHR